MAADKDEIIRRLCLLIQDKVESEGSSLCGPTNYEAAWGERNATKWICQCREVVAEAYSAIRQSTKG